MQILSTLYNILIIILEAIPISHLSQLLLKLNNLVTFPKNEGFIVDFYYNIVKDCPKGFELIICLNKKNSFLI